jgi:aspartokinase/homoserine dehydrogenase 1
MEMLVNLPVMLLGVGGVGRALLRQIVEQRGWHAEHFGLEIAIVGVADSAGALLADGSGLDDETLTGLLRLKEAGGKVTDLPTAIREDEPTAVVNMALDRMNRPGVVVDCTATERSASALLAALDRGGKVVLANKKPLTIQQEVYDRLTRAGVTDGPLSPARARWETTCGAGLPVIVTLNRLLMSGDSVHRITGTFSGTLGYVMSGLQAGRPFSQVVREAHQRGYTEPDPRDDLGGVDVGRKALILARGLGWQLDMADVEIQGLYPLHMDSLNVAQFLAALPELDEYFAGQVRAATMQGKVLRYAAAVEGGRCRVGPVMVDAASPLGRLSGTDNLIEFHTRWYSPNPLVVQGRGAGVDATAAGVLSDVVELAFTN